MTVDRRARSAATRAGAPRKVEEDLLQWLRLIEKTTATPLRSGRRPGEPEEQATHEVHRFSSQDDLLGPAGLPDYNAQESLYSSHVHEAVLALLRGERNELSLMVKHHREPGRLGALQVPSTIDSNALRQPRVEEILVGAIRFLRDGSSGSSLGRMEIGADGRTRHLRDFPTRFTDVVLRRTDECDSVTGEAIRSSWSAHRVQSRRSGNDAGRAMEALNLGMGVLKFVL